MTFLRSLQIWSQLTNDNINPDHIKWLPIFLTWESTKAHIWLKASEKFFKINIKLPSSKYLVWKVVEST
jgi:hypothetical protein